MLNAKDSLINLRLGLKRPHPEQQQQHQKRPIDDLRAQVAAKRQRREGGKASASVKAVRFDTGRNTVREIHAHTKDLENAWLSRSDTARIRTMNLQTIAAFRAGDIDHVDCLRGLELHATKELLEKKIENGRNFTKAILQQQGFLRNMMGRANELILGRMSNVLSAEDANDAHHTGQMDAKEASMIHVDASATSLPPPAALDHAVTCDNQQQQLLSPTMNKNSKEGAEGFSQDSLVRLLLCSQSCCPAGAS